MTHWPLLVCGIVIGLALFPTLFFAATAIIRDAREFRRRVAPLNDQAREEGRLRGLVLSGAVVTPMPARRIRMKGERHGF